MRKRKILLVDDSEVSREMIRFILEDRGWEVVTLAAPFLFATTLIKEKPDLALIEVNLAALSGDQLVRLNRMSGRAPVGGALPCGRSGGSPPPSARPKSRRPAHIRC